MKLTFSFALASIMFVCSSCSGEKPAPAPATTPAVPTAAVPAPSAPTPDSSTKAKKFANVDPDAFDKLRQSSTNIVVLDVRTPKEYAKGHIPGSVLMDFNSPNFAAEVAKLNKDKTYLVHCAAGGRSSSACKLMETMDFKDLYNLEGGMGAWEEAGKPVVKK